LLITGDVGSGVEDVITQGGELPALSFSRSAESEADRRSGDLMRKPGTDPLAIARFFDVIDNRLGDNSKTSILSSHPGTPDRKDAVLEGTRNLR
jgi:predicted Zn-dependent protease